MARLRKIAVEEACSIPEVANALRDVLRGPGRSSDAPLLKSMYDPQAKGDQIVRLNYLDLLYDVEDRRLKEMDALGIDMHVLSLTGPGVQMFDADTANELATMSNDRIADICRRNPTRFAGLASFAPHSPKRAAREMERAINDLGMNGFIVNSHTNDEYLDDPKYFPILEAAEALDRCLYLHPRGPSAGLAGPMLEYGMSSANWGYGVEVATHVVRMIKSGLFDRFPKLKICIGHMGEALPFWLWRITFMHSRSQKQGRVPMTELTFEEYFHRNFVVSTSGVEDPLCLRFTIDKLGADKVIWAIDYPYQPQEPAVRFLNDASLSDDERAKISHLNAERIFHIAPLE